MFKIVSYVVISGVIVYCLLNFLSAMGVLHLVKYKDLKQRTKAKKYFFWLSIGSILLLLSEYLAG